MIVVYYCFENHMSRYIHTSTLLCRVWQCARNTAREQWDYSLLYHSGFRNSLYANDVTYSLGNLYWSVSSTGSVTNRDGHIVWNQNVKTLSIVNNPPRLYII